LFISKKEALQELELQEAQSSLTTRAVLVETTSSSSSHFLQYAVRIRCIVKCAVCHNTNYEK